jgi:hypothetical protein
VHELCHRAQATFGPGGGLRAAGPRQAQSRDGAERKNKTNGRRRRLGEVKKPEQAEAGGGVSVPVAGMFEKEDEPPGGTGLPSRASASSTAAEHSEPAPLPAAEDAETAFAASYEAEVSRLHEAMQHGTGGDSSAQILGHLAQLRALSSQNDFALSSTHAKRAGRYKAARAEAREWVELRLHELVASFHLASHEDNDLLAMDAAVRAARDLVARAAAEVGDLSLFGEILDALEAQLRSKLELVIKKANRHELRLLYTDFLLRPAEHGPGLSEPACASADASGSDAPGLPGGWRGLRALCLRKYREQVERHVHSESVVATSALHKVLTDRQATAGCAPSFPDHADYNHRPRPSLAAVEAEEAIGFPAVGVIRLYLEGIARVADELQDGALLPSDFVATAHAELEQVGIKRPVPPFGGGRHLLI